MKKITLVDKNKELIDLAQKELSSTSYVEFKAIHGDILEYHQKTENTRIATASNPEFKPTGGLDKILNDNFGFLDAKEFSIDDNLLFCITVDDNLKSAESIVVRSLVGVFAYSTQHEIIISGMGTGIGGLYVTKFIKVLKEVLDRNLGGANLQRANLGGANLQRANLRGADLQRANLGGADLKGANLRNANLRYVDLRDADLRAAGLQGANLQGADLRNANLRYAGLQNTKLGGANLQRANLGGADLRHAGLQDANLKGTDLRSADLRHAGLQNTKLGGANLQRAYLRGADLRYAGLKGANLQGANSQRADLRHAGLQNTKLGGANLQYVDLRNADLRDADLRAAGLQGANLQGANLQGADLQEIKVDYLTISFYNIPQKIDLYGYKKCKNGVIVKVLIPRDAKRSCATTRKCRAEFVKVVEVYGADVAISGYDYNVVYKKGEIVHCNYWDDDRWNECSGGIHFFLTRKEARDWYS